MIWNLLNGMRLSPDPEGLGGGDAPPEPVQGESAPAPVGDTDSSAITQPPADETPPEPPDGTDLSGQTVPYNRFTEVNVRLKNSEESRTTEAEIARQNEWRLEQEISKLQAAPAPQPDPAPTPAPADQKRLLLHPDQYYANEDWKDGGRMADSFATARSKEAVDPVAKELAELKQTVAKIENQEFEKAERAHNQHIIDTDVYAPAEAELRASENPRFDVIKAAAIRSTNDSIAQDPKWRHKPDPQRVYEMKQMYKYSLKEALRQDALMVKGIRDEQIQDLRKIIPAVPATADMAGEAVPPEHDALKEAWEKGELGNTPDANDAAYQEQAAQRDIDKMSR